MNNIFGRIVHVWFKRPFYLARAIDEGEGATVVLLHGIGRTGTVWEHVVDLLRRYSCRIIAFDLLGFGYSPKPKYIDYNVDDHARAVIASLEKVNSDQPVILVGHSMGCLIAVRVAMLRPDLIKSMVLFEMPLYEGLPNKRVYKLRLSLYSRFYYSIINYKPDFNEESRRKLDKLAQKIAGFEVNEESWVPFIRSLENTIINQTAKQDIPYLNIPIDVIYGLYDMLVIRGKAEQIFGSDSRNITSHNVRARHVISQKASRLIVERIATSISAAAAF